MARADRCDACGCWAASRQNTRPRRRKGTKVTDFPFITSGCPASPQATLARSCVIRTDKIRRDDAPDLAQAYIAEMNSSTDTPAKPAVQGRHGNASGSPSPSSATTRPPRRHAPLQPAPSQFPLSDDGFQPAVQSRPSQRPRPAPQFQRPTRSARCVPGTYRALKLHTIRTPSASTSSLTMHSRFTARSLSPSLLLFQSPCLPSKITAAPMADKASPPPGSQPSRSRRRRHSRRSPLPSAAPPPPT